MLKKLEFLENSTSPAPETHFRTPLVPKSFQKSTNNHPKTYERSNKEIDRILNGFLIDLESTLEAVWTDFGHQNRLKWSGPKRVRGVLAPSARRTRPGVPLGSQNGRQGPPQDPKMEPQGSPKSAKIVPFATPESPKSD